MFDITFVFKPIALALSSARSLSGCTFFHGLSSVHPLFYIRNRERESCWMR